MYWLLVGSIPQILAPHVLAYHILFCPFYVSGSETSQHYKLDRKVPPFAMHHAQRRCRGDRIKWECHPQNTIRHQKRPQDGERRHNGHLPIKDKTNA